MMRRRRYERTIRPARAGFTLMELLVVIAIIAILAGLVAVAVIPTIGNARLRNTRTLLKKMDHAVDQKWDAVLRTVSPAQISPTVMAYAGGDSERALVMQRAIVLKANFPMTYREAWDSGIQSYRRILKADPGPGPAKPSESAACLLMALKRPVSGVTFDVNEVLGPDAIKDTDGDGIEEIVDGYGQPIQFYRWSCYFPDMVAESSNGRGDPLDPDRRLMDTTWRAANPLAVTWFQSNFYPITDSSGQPYSFYTRPLLVSWGKDGQIGMGAYGQIIDSVQAADNVYSSREK